MEVMIKFDIHIYMRERLADDIFDSAPRYGILGPSIVLPMLAVKDHEILFRYDETTTICDVVSFISATVWPDPETRQIVNVTYAFTYGGERFTVLDGDKPFSFLLSTYLDPLGTQRVTANILVSSDAGNIGFEHPLRFSVESNENCGHNEPHIHVADFGNEHTASVRIIDGKVIKGNLPPKLAKLAKKTILSDQDYFFECWNTMTNGLKVDINHHYRYIGY